MENDAAAGGLGLAAFCMTFGFVMIIGLLPGILMIVGLWKCFEKAGKPGWASIVPVYNFMVIAEVGKKESWWGLLILVPCVNIFIAIYLWMEFFKQFGKDSTTAILFALFPFIGAPMVGFGESKYAGKWVPVNKR